MKELLWIFVLLPWLSNSAPLHHSDLGFLSRRGATVCGEANGGKSCGKGLCCSLSGFCGIGFPYCGVGCQENHGICWPISNPKDDNVTISDTQLCGPGVDQKCPDGFCCSANGECGTNSDQCTIYQGCQPDYGTCLPENFQCGLAFGNEKCGVVGWCCSVTGFCGTSPDYCDANLGCYSECTSETVTDEPNPTTDAPAPTDSTTTTDDSTTTTDDSTTTTDFSSSTEDATSIDAETSTDAPTSTEETEVNTTDAPTSTDAPEVTTTDAPTSTDEETLSDQTSVEFSTSTEDANVSAPTSTEDATTSDSMTTTDEPSPSSEIMSSADESTTDLVTDIITFPNTALTSTVEMPITTMLLTDIATMTVTPSNPDTESPQSTPSVTATNDIVTTDEPRMSTTRPTKTSRIRSTRTRPHTDSRRVKTVTATQIIERSGTTVTIVSVKTQTATQGLPDLPQITPGPQLAEPSVTGARCGPEFGNPLCPIGTCCSQWGYCGDTIAHCQTPNCLYQCSAARNDGPALAPSLEGVRCGFLFNNATCPGSNCCSRWGYCGITNLHCMQPNCIYQCTQ